MPFNWKTPFGYLIAFSLESIEVSFECLFGSMLNSFFIGSCFLLRTCVKDITTDLDSLNVREKKTTNRDWAKKIKAVLCDAVQDHSKLKQFSIISTLTVVS